MLPSQDRQKDCKFSLFDSAPSGRAQGICFKRQAVGHIKWADGPRLACSISSLLEPIPADGGWRQSKRWTFYFFTDTLVAFDSFYCLKSWSFSQHWFGSHFNNVCLSVRLGKVSLTASSPSPSGPRFHSQVEGFSGSNTRAPELWRPAWRDTFGMRSVGSSSSILDFSRS